MQMLTFGDGTPEKSISRQPIPDPLQENALLWRETMLESLYGHSEALMELALQEEEIPEDLIHQVIREATIERQIQPVLCGSALHGIGVQPLLDAVANYLPSPANRPAVEGEHPSRSQKDLSAN